MSESVHTARWIEQIVEQGWDLHLFAATESRPHSALRQITVHSFYKYPHHTNDESLRQTGATYPLRRGATTLRRVAERTLPTHWSASARLARLISQLKPDIIHSLEMQRAGYLTMDAFCASSIPPATPWIYSCWGNDLFNFAGQAQHAPRIRAVLSRCNYLIADCRRDVALAHQNGFQGEVLGVLPVGGGFEIEKMRDLLRPKNPSKRNLILIKGYQHQTWGGRALVALEAIERCAETLRSYEIVIYSACETVRGRAQDIAKEKGLRLRVIPPVMHSEIIALMAQARIALGVSVSDGVPNTMLEAMTMGAFPIQSDTGSTAEWIVHGKNGLLVPPEDAGAISRAIERALEDDNLVDEAATLNLDLVSRIDRRKVQQQAIDIYNYVYTKSKSSVAGQ